MLLDDYLEGLLHLRRGFLAGKVLKELTDAHFDTLLACIHHVLG